MGTDCAAARDRRRMKRAKPPTCRPRLACRKAPFLAKTDAFPQAEPGTVPVIACSRIRIGAYRGSDSRRPIRPEKRSVGFCPKFAGFSQVGPGEMYRVPAGSPEVTREGPRSLHFPAPIAPFPRASKKVLSAPAAPLGRQLRAAASSDQRPLS